MTEQTTTTSTFIWNELATRDLAAGKAFYTQLFGWDSEEAPMPGEMPGNYVLFKLGDVDIGGAYEMAGEMFYIPKVAENEYPVPFRCTSMESGRVVFENPTHDFPLKIIYQRSGEDELTVTIEGPGGAEGTRQVDFHFRRAGP